MKSGKQMSNILDNLFQKTTTQQAVEENMRGLDRQMLEEEKKWAEEQERKMWYAQHTQHPQTPSQSYPGSVKTSKATVLGNFGEMKIELLEGEDFTVRSLTTNSLKPPEPEELGIHPNGEMFIYLGEWRALLTGSDHKKKVAHRGQVLKAALNKELVDNLDAGVVIFENENAARKAKEAGLLPQTFVYLRKEDKFVYVDSQLNWHDVNYTNQSPPKPRELIDSPEKVREKEAVVDHNFRF
jgi:hypothetical protein